MSSSTTRGVPGRSVPSPNSNGCHTCAFPFRAGPMSATKRGAAAKTLPQRVKRLQHHGCPGRMMTPGGPAQTQRVRMVRGEGRSVSEWYRVRDAARPNSTGRGTQRVPSERGCSAGRGAPRARGGAVARDVEGAWGEEPRLARAVQPGEAVRVVEHAQPAAVGGEASVGRGAAADHPACLR